MDQTPNLLLPYIMAAQAQKHVTHNEAIRALDAIVQIAVLDRDLAVPPATPANGDRYIVAAGAAGTWVGQALALAAYQDGAWQLFAPREGWIAWIADEDIAVAWNGTAWVTLSGGNGTVNPTPLVGVNATADTTNRLSVSSPNTLLNHAGSDHRLKINKAIATDTASVLFQDAFSGRAELGLAGDDDLHVKVSADGTTWRDALIVNRSTGAISMPFTSLGSGSSAPTAPGGRLTLVAGTPIMNASSSGNMAHRFTPHLGKHAPVYDGTGFVMVDLGGELTQATTDATKSPAAVAANSVYDVFVWLDGATPRATRGPAWTSATARGAGAGTSELEHFGGFWVNKAAIANGPVARRGLYVGSFRSNAAAQLDWTLNTSGAGGVESKLHVWNLYNPVHMTSTVTDTNGSWTSTFNGFEALDVGAAGGVGNRCSVLRGLDILPDMVDLRVPVFAAAGSNGGVGIGLDSVTANAAQILSNITMSSQFIIPPSAVYAGFPGLGFHFFQALQRPSVSGAVTTFGGTFGTNFFQSGLVVQHWC
jgi:hypothetical protein